MRVRTPRKICTTGLWLFILVVIMQVIMSIKLKVTKDRPIMSLTKNKLIYNSIASHLYEGLAGKNNSIRNQSSFRALCPDIRAKTEETPIEEIAGPGKTIRVLGEGWGNLTFKETLLTKWNRENEAKLQDPKFTSLCEQDMTFGDESVNGSLLPYCPCYNERMQGNVEIDFNPVSWPEMAQIYSAYGVQNGGLREPSECRARQKVAFIIPYMDRLNHLHILINHLHKVLTRQDLHYRIFVVEQAHPNIFNKAAIMDAAFLEVQKLWPEVDCVVFHDVDMLQEDDRNVFGCMKHEVRHLASHIDKYDYVGGWGGVTIGGCVAFPVELFQRVNGFATVYWGWGGEDDDMYHRIRDTLKKHTYRHPQSLARFTMIKHPRDKNNPQNVHRRKIAQDIRAKGYNATLEDGLSSLKYSVHAQIERPLYTWIYAEALSPLSDFYYREGTCKIKTTDSNVTSPYLSKHEPQISCASLCKNHDKCHMFQLQLSRHNSLCSLFDHNCAEVSFNATNENYSFIYTKGRSVPIMQQALQNQRSQGPSL